MSGWNRVLSTASLGYGPEMASTPTAVRAIHARRWSRDCGVGAAGSVEPGDVTGSHFLALQTAFGVPCCVPIPRAATTFGSRSSHRLAETPPPAPTRARLVAG